MNKKDILDKLKSLDGLNNDERAYLVNLVKTKKKYGLVWEDKPEKVEEQLRTKLPILKEVKERAIINDTETEKHPNHILIEGDNLHALTALTFTHENKIDLIYIDPPYNRGENDFIYNDNYIDKEDTFRHSKWLSFIERRLKIAHRLLSDKGIFVCSIDDNELAQLKMLCDEIFGQKNFIDIFSWVRTETPARLSKKSLKVTEYLIAFQKSMAAPDLVGFKSKSSSSNTLLNQTNKMKTLTFPANKVVTGLKDGEIKKGVYGTKSYQIILEEDCIIKNGLFSTPVIMTAKFRWGQEKLDYEINEGTIIGMRTKTLSPSYEKSEYSAGAPKNLIDRNVEVYTNETAKTELQSLELPAFDYPKPTSLIEYIISFNPKDNLTVLDFFAGSGTTLHATINLNDKDKGNRQCILVTNNENNIAEEVTYERNKRVIQGYTNAKGQEIEGLNNNNLRYYQCDFVERDPSLSNKRQLTQLATELLCIKEDCFQEVTSKLNTDTSVGSGQVWNKLFTNGLGQYVYVVYDDLYIEDAVEALAQFVAKEAPVSKIKVYVFANGQYAYAEEFEDIAENIMLAALPDAIYKAYQNVLPKENKKFVPILEDGLIE